MVPAQANRRRWGVCVVADEARGWVTRYLGFTWTSAGDAPLTASAMANFICPSRGTSKASRRISSNAAVAWWLLGIFLTRARISAFAAAKVAACCVKWADNPPHKWEDIPQKPMHERRVAPISGLHDCKTLRGVLARPAAPIRLRCLPPLLGESSSVLGGPRSTELCRLKGLGGLSL